MVIDDILFKRMVAALQTTINGTQIAEEMLQAMGETDKASLITKARSAAEDVLRDARIAGLINGAT